MSRVIIREGNAADCQAVLDLLLDAFGVYRGQFQPQPSVYKETVQTLQARLDTQTLLVAESSKADPKIVGCLYYYPQAQTLYLGRLATDAAYRKQGIAAKLIERVEDAARAKGIDAVLLEVRIPLRENVAFFEKCGYQITGSHAHEGYALPTYFSMQKSIAKPITTRHLA